MTIGDFVMYSVCQIMFLNEGFKGQPFFRNEFDKYPRLKAYADTIGKEFQSWTDTRPLQEL